MNGGTDFRELSGRPWLMDLVTHICLCKKEKEGLCKKWRYTRTVFRWQFHSWMNKDLVLVVLVVRHNISLSMSKLCFSLGMSMSFSSWSVHSALCLYFFCLYVAWDREIFMIFCHKWMHYKSLNHKMFVEWLGSWSFGLGLVHGFWSLFHILKNYKRIKYVCANMSTNMKASRHNHLCPKCFSCLWENVHTALIIKPTSTNWRTFHPLRNQLQVWLPYL